MTKSPFYRPIYLLLFLSLVANACQGQTDTQLPKQPTFNPDQWLEGTGTAKQQTSEAIDALNDPTIVSQYIRSIFQDSKGNYWFGPAFESVARYDGDSLHYFSKTHFFRGNQSVERDRGNSVHAITEDQAGNIWFGTDHGAVKYDGKNFRSYTQKDGLSNTSVGRKCILTDVSGKVWVGTKRGVFYHVPSAKAADGPAFQSFALLSDIQVTDIMEDDAGDLWFASKDQGVFRYDGEKIDNLSDLEGLGSNYAGGMGQDAQGNYWFTMKDGFCKYDGESFTSYTTEDGLGGSEVWGLIIEDSGIIWITARGSTTRFDPSVPVSDPNAFQVFRPEDGLNCCVQSMYQDRSGNMWWGTGQGLYRFDGVAFYQVKKNGPW